MLSVLQAFIVRNPKFSKIPTMGDFLKKDIDFVALSSGNALQVLFTAVKLGIRVP